MTSFIKTIFQRMEKFVHSVRFRLAAWFMLILAMVLLVFSTFIYTRQARDLQRETVSRLEDKIRVIQSLNSFSGREPFESGLNIPNISQDAGPLLQTDEVLAVTDLHGQVVQKYGPVSNTDVNQLANQAMEQIAGQSSFSYTLLSATSNGQQIPKNYLFLVVPLSFGSRAIGFLILGSPVDPTAQLHRLLLTLILGGVSTLGVALAGGYWLANRAMRPVNAITQAARQISETDLSRRLNLKTQDELGELADTFDRMLARLQAAFDRQRQFTADASHELRTPLTIVNLETERALSGKRTGKDYEQALMVIQSENEFMTRLVNNLLTLSRLDAGQTVLEMDEVDLSDLALEVVERMAPIAHRNQVELSAGELPELIVRGDRQFLNQMITNLVENAIKYTRAPQKRVWIETGQDCPQDRPVAWLRVNDNGEGIPPEHLPHLFDRFYQVDRARSHQAEQSEDYAPNESQSAGSGLGLSIVQWIARAHGGEVGVQSEAGKGTVFEVRLPLKEWQPAA